jgi:hypothetical protein
MERQIKSQIEIKNKESLVDAFIGLYIGSEL